MKLNIGDVVRIASPEQYDSIPESATGKILAIGWDLKMNKKSVRVDFGGDIQNFNYYELVKA